MHEWGPLAAVAIALWIKQLYFALVLQSLWPQQSFSRWAATHPAAFATTLGSVLVLLAPLALVGARWRLPVALAMDVALTLLIVADEISLWFYGDVLSIASWTDAPMLEAAWRSVASVLRWRHALYFADVALGVLLLPILAALRRRADPGVPRRLSVALAMLVAGAMLLSPALYRALLDDNGAAASTNLQRTLCDDLGIFSYHALDLAWGGREDRRPDEEELATVDRVLERRRREAAVRSPLFGVARGADLILINAESLSAFPLGLQVAGRAVTPRLDAFAGESLDFAAFFDQTHLGTTSDAQLAALNSLYPVAVGYTEDRYANNHFEALPAILAEHGYDTVSACGADGGFWSMRDRHARYGFQRSWYEDAFPGAERLGPWLSDGDFFRGTLDLLRSRPSPVFAFLLTSSNHHPFAVAAVASGLELPPALAGSAVGDYLASAHYFDAAFGVLVDRLRDDGRLDRSVVALYGDHQAFLGEPPELAELLGFAPSSALGHFLAKKRLPFLVRLPGGREAGTQPAPGGHVDVAPTLLSLLGIESGDRAMLGRDLTAGGSGLAVLRDGSFVTPAHVFLNRFGPISKSRCYERSSGREVDPRPFEALRAEALERLAASDAILRGDLVPSRSLCYASPRL